MPLTNLNLITVTGTYKLLDGLAASGTVSFSTSTIVTDTVANEIIFPKPFVVTLNSSGSFSIQIPATDDPDVTPTNFTYTVTETITGSGTRTYSISVPVATPGSLDLADVAHVPGSVPTTGFVVTTDPRLSNARVPTGGAGGVLAGTYPSPAFAVDMATQSELQNHLDTHDLSRTIADGVLVNGVAFLDSPTEAQFTDEDIGLFVAGPGVPANAIIISRQSATRVTMSAAASTGGSGLTIRIGASGGGGEPADNSVSTVKMVDAAVTTAKINDGSVTAAKLATDSVTNTKLATDSVSSGKIVTDAVTAAKIAADAVGTAEIATGAVTDVELASAAVTTTKLADTAVTNAKLATDAVTAAKIADGAVTSGKISAGTLALDRLASPVVTQGTFDTAPIFRTRDAAVADRSSIADIIDVNGTDGQLDFATPYPTGDADLWLKVTTLGVVAAVNNRILRIIYNGTKYPARPSSASTPFVEFIGPAEPTAANSVSGTGWLDGDTWWDV